MNIRKGFFRLTLVLSILIGIIIPICHGWIFDEKSVIEISFPVDWSLQEKLRMHGTGLRVNTEYLLLSQIERSNIERQLRETLNSEAKRPPEIIDPWDKYRVYHLSFKVGWRELGLLAFVGFASPWLIYLFIRWVIIAFIVGGFQGSSAKGGKTG